MKLNRKANIVGALMIAGGAIASGASITSGAMAADDSGDAPTANAVVIGSASADGDAYQCEFDDLDNQRAPLDAAFYADSRSRAPEAYRNVIEMAGVIDRLIAERNDLESRFAEVSVDHREEHKRLVAMGAECDDLRAEVARLGAPGATMDGATR